MNMHACEHAKQIHVNCELQCLDPVFGQDVGKQTSECTNANSRSIAFAYLE